MFWIYAGNNVDDTKMFSLLMSSTYTESRPFLLLTLPHQQMCWGCTRSWDETQQGQLTPPDQRDIPACYCDTELVDGHCSRCRVCLEGWAGDKISCHLSGLRPLWSNAEEAGRSPVTVDLLTQSIMFRPSDY